MDIELIERYRKKSEYLVWLLVIALTVFVNLSNLESITNQRNILLIILLLIIAFTVIHYRFIAKKINTFQSIFAAILVYSLLVNLFIHFSGSLNSPLFSLVVVPILLTAMMLNQKYLLAISSVQIFWYLIEYFVFFIPQFQITDNPIIYFWQNIFLIVFVTIISISSSQEVDNRQREHTHLIAEQNKLSEHTQREDAVLGSVSEIVIALSKSGDVVFANQSFERFSHLTSKDYVNKKYYDIFKVYKIDQLGSLLAEIDLLLTREYSLYYAKDPNEDSPQYKIICNKNELFIEMTNTPLHLSTDKTSESSGVVIVMRDISEKRQLELMKLDFVSMAAHELRTPITAIRGYLDALKQEAWSKLTEDEQRFIQRADIASIQLATLMENLLSVSRIERGTYNLSLQSVDWIQLLNQRIDEFQNRVKERSIELRWQPPTSPTPKVSADPMRIIEVINNLISNAINYTPEGYIEVTIEYDSKNEMIITHIKDTGQGIPKEALNHMFEKFFRVSGVLEQGSKGTGLGLYISKQIISLHHGTIWVDSEVGKGSMFSFSLPTINNKTINITVDKMADKLNDNK